MLVRQIGMDNSRADRIHKEKPIVTGNPYILRNFLYADDAMGAFTGAFRHDWCKGQVYNLGAIRGYDWGTYHIAVKQISSAGMPEWFGAVADEEDALEDKVIDR